MKNYIVFLLLFFPMLCLANTGANSSAHAQVKPLTGLPCLLQDETESAHWLSDTEALQQLLNKMPQAVIDQTVRLPAFDFEKRHLLRVSMGQQPSMGYELQLLDEKLKSDGKDLVLSLRWKQPEADKFHAAVITYPCIWLDMPKLAGMKLRIVDEKGKQHFRLP